MNYQRLFLFLSLSLAACSSPTARIEPKMREFKAKYPNQISSYTVDDRKMEYAWSGDPSKQPLLFIHGSPGRWDVWSEFLLNEDLQKNFQLIAVDRPGYGSFDVGQTERSLKKQALDVMAVLKINHSGKKAIVVGHSYAGAVLAQIGVDQPDEISALIFVSSSVDPSLESNKWYQYPASWWPISALIPSRLRVCNEEIFALKGELELLQNRWGEIKADVASIQGESDDLVPPGNQDYILKKIPAAQVKFIKRVPGMNHFVPWEHPELILEAIHKIAP